MSDGALAPALSIAAAGLALSFASSQRAQLWAVAALLASALAAALPELPAAFAAPALVGCWFSVIAAAAAVHLRRGSGSGPALALAVNCGLWAGLVSGAEGGLSTLAPALPLALLCLPGGWLVARGRGIAVKVVLSWLAAAAVLSIGLGMAPTLGYEPDHRE
jgi:hypothetical protein